MSSIDERVVGMKFDNAQFQQGTKDTLDSLDALNKGLKLDGATKGLNDIGAAAQNLHLDGLAGAVDDIASHFRAMSIVAITALANIVTRAVDAGINIGRSLTVDPIKSGLQEFETNMNSIQTILSNTRWQNTGLKDVNAALDELNHYSDLTIYNFSQMAKNIGTFTAAGVKLDVATSAIKGIANLAAVSGSNADQASAAMYQLSQAIATGTVKLIDWNSVVNAGLGGKVFQDALIQTAKVHGVAVDQMVKQEGSFRATLENGWLNSQILTETLSHFTGDLTKQQLISMHYTSAQADAIVAMGKDATNAATKVKTISQLLSTLQEAAGSGWTKTWQLIFGDFQEAEDFFTDANNAITGFIQTSADARNKVLTDWKALGGRTVLIEGIKLAFNDLLEVIHPIELAFRDVFPKTTGKQLYDITVAVRDFLSEIRLGEDTMTNIRRTFAGLFSIFGIGWDVVKALAGVFATLFHIASAGADGGFLDFTARIGDFLVGLRAAIHEGTAFTDFFTFLTVVLAAPIRLLQKIGTELGTLFGKFDGKAAAAGIGDFIGSLRPMTSLADTIIAVWAGVTSTFGKLWKVLEPIGSKLAGFFQEISTALGGLNFGDLLKAINTGAFVTLVAFLKNSLGKKDGIAGAISQLTETLGAMQNTLNATAILEVALAIGILALAIGALSKVDAKSLGTALTAIGIMFAQLVAAMAVLQKLPNSGAVRILLTAAAMTGLAVAIDVLTIAVEKLSKIDVKGLHRGLVGVMVLLGSVVAAVKLMPPATGLISTGVGLTILAVAINILVKAVTDLSGLSWVELAKGLTSVGILLASLALFTKLADVSVRSVFTGAGIILLAVALNLLSTAVHDISTLSWESIGKGMTVLAVSLGIMGAALNLIPPSSVISAAGVLIISASLGLLADALQQMGGFDWITIGKGVTTLGVALTAIALALKLIPPTAPLQAAGVLIVATSLKMLADAVAQMGGMNWSTIGKGLTVLAGGLGIIAGALNLMDGTLPGAAALLIVCSSLVILTGVLMVMGSMAWSEIGTGLAVLAGALTILGLAGLLIGPVAPALLALAGAVALFGLGLALAGAGVFLFATAMTALSVAGAAGTAALVAIVSAMLGLIPTMIKQVGIGLLLVVKIVDDAAPAIVKTFLDILVLLLDGIITIAPKFGEALLVVIAVLLAVLIAAVPMLANAGYKMLLGILKAIRDNIHDMVVVGGQIVQQFLKGLGDSLPGMIQSGIDFILKFINALGVAADNNGSSIGKAVANLGINLIKGLIKGLYAIPGAVGDALIDIAKHAIGAFLDFLGISSPSKVFKEFGRYMVQGLAIGLATYSQLSTDASKKVGSDAVDGVKESLSTMADAVGTDMDMTPTITPVLDLTNVKKGAGQLSTLLSTKPVQPNTSYSSAKQAGDGFDDNNATNGDNATSGNTYNNFTQNNNSPKALSAADIYRQTKNQLSTAKGGLPK